MKRIHSNKRPDWQRKAEQCGFFFHSIGEGYWNESAYYSFASNEIESIEHATAALHQMCIKAVQEIIEHDRFDELKIPFKAIPLILRSWENDERDLYGRFDFSYVEGQPPKMLEYNADTPTSLLEASVMQWNWKEEILPQTDQFNSIHERLVQTWKELLIPGELLHFSCLKDSDEDLGTIEYLRDAAIAAGLTTRVVFIEDIGWDPLSQRFVDSYNDRISALFKLYPWEWLIHDEYSTHLDDQRLRLVEPAWKMVLSNKGILPILWELFPEHPNLLPCYTTPQKLPKGFVRKPLLSREGANIAIQTDNFEFQTSGEYGAEGFVYQQFAPLPEFSGRHPVIGSWVIGGEPAGMGIREDNSLVTKNTSFFVPHVIQ